MSWRCWAAKYSQRIWYVQKCNAYDWAIVNYYKMTRLKIQEYSIQFNFLKKYTTGILLLISFGPSLWFIPCKWLAFLTLTIRSIETLTKNMFQIYLRFHFECKKGKKIEEFLWSVYLKFDIFLWLINQWKSQRKYLESEK